MTQQIHEAGGPIARPLHAAQSRDWWLTIGMIVSASAALVSSFSGLRALAIATGWASLMAPLLPLTVDAFTLTATRVWLSAVPTPRRARRFARWNAVGAILLSLAGNASYHAIAAGLFRVNWFIVVVVGAIPPLVLGLVSHLAALRTQDSQAVSVPVPRTAPAIEDGPQYDRQDELLAAARTADARHWETHGKPITRDALRKQLRISSNRATEVLRMMRQATADEGQR